MPTYEYKCKECGHVFEKFHSINAEPVKECPVCNGNVERMIGTGIGLIFKGSGFYITDYKNKKNKDNNSNIEKSTKKDGDIKKGSADSKKGNKSSESKSDKSKKINKN